jgi:predicted ester cyclase
MATENQDTVQRVIEEVWNNGNLDSIPDLFASESVTFEPSAQVLSGREAYGHYVAGYRAAFPSLHFTIEDLQPKGDEVTLRWTATGMNPGLQPDRSANSNASGVSGMTIFRLASGKIVESWVHWDTAGMLQKPGAVSKTP